MGMYAALIRAVNVGGTGRLSMPDLSRICGEAGFDKVRTYIASGNVVFWSDDKSETVRLDLASRLSNHTGRAVEVFVRTAAEMRAVLDANPYAEAEPARTYAFFLSTKPPKDALATVRHQKDEQISLGRREIYVHYPSGMGQSKLVVPAGSSGTARNMNTVAKLVELTA